MSNHLDPVSVAITILATLLSPAVGAILGPYAVIFLASTTGAGWSLSRRATRSKTEAFWFFIRVNATAGLLTYGVAQLVSMAYKMDSVVWLFGPIAFGIGLVGDDWPAVRHWLFEKILAWRTAGNKE